MKDVLKIAFGVCIGLLMFYLVIGGSIQVMLFNPLSLFP